jgi:hypothetical protein
MNTSQAASDQTVVAAYRAAMLHQGLIALLILAAVLAWAGYTGRLSLPWRRARTHAGGRYPAAKSEPGWRRLLRVGFGILWVFDGLLQAQPRMPVGLVSQVIAPTAAASPAWVQHLVAWGTSVWSSHPVPAASAVVWIQAGIGLWLLAAATGPCSRLAGLASAGWALVIWVFGESFGTIFAPGLSWLTGAPGAAVFYWAAGALIALPQEAWRLPWLGRAILTLLGMFFAGMAVLQAWPGRGFWQGTPYGAPGTLASTVQAMAQTPQPGFLASWLSGFASFDATHGFAVNLFAAAALSVSGAGLLAGRPRTLRPLVLFVAALCLTDWVLVEDLGFLGGLGTDPNSMIPLLLLVISGYRAISAQIPGTASADPGAPFRAGAVNGTAPGPTGRSRDRRELEAEQPRVQQPTADSHRRRVEPAPANSITTSGCCLGDTSLPLASDSTP